MRAVVRFAIVVAAIVTVFVAGAGAWLWSTYTRAGIQGEATVIVHAGSGLRKIAQRLTHAGIIKNPNIFMIGVRVDGLAGNMQAGEYAFPAGASPRDVARHIVSGKTVVRRLTVPEGLTTSQVIELVSRAEGLIGNLPRAAAGEAAYYPDTYHYSWGDQRTALLARMSAAMKQAVESAWAKRKPGIEIVTPKEMVVLASIIEKETAVAAERDRVSAVFHNRLRRSMRLQSDPTVVYALIGGAGSLGRPLSRADLKFDSPYNTYMAAGLPPGPIATPRGASLEAAVRPVDSKDLYFVADGKGGHAFARTLAEHNRNVAKWRRYLRQQKQVK